MWQQLAEARRILKGGGVVGMPTETVYGLAARIGDPQAVKSIFTLKTRPFFDPLIVHIARHAQLAQLAAEVSDAADHLAKHFWPGPLTLVLPRRASINPMISAGLPTVGIRMPSHPLARRLISQVGEPLAAPSANRFGKTSPTTAAHVRREFNDEVFVLDGGSAHVGLESTVLAVEESHGAVKLHILRPGIVTAEQVREIFSDWHQPVTVSTGIDRRSPGHTNQHYVPDIPLILYHSDAVAALEQAVEQLKANGRIKEDRRAELRLNPDPLLAARELYASLRTLGESGAELIVCEVQQWQHGGAWEAIWDRLMRAAEVKIQ